MKRIVCFGDSNTYGYIPNNGKRYSSDIRWTSRLSRLLGKEFEVINAGCNNRTCFIDNPAGEYQTGYKAIKKYLSMNVDVFVLSIGINDSQLFYKPSLDDFRRGLTDFILQIQNSSDAKIVLVAPPILNDDVLKGNFSFQFDTQSIELSKYLPELYKKVADENNCYYFDMNDKVKVSNLDGLHYLPAEHELIAKLLFEFLSKII